MTNRIFAHHAHVFPENVRSHGTVKRLLELMDACGIERAVAFAPFAYQVGTQGAESSIWLSKEIKDEARLVGFGTIDFDRPIAEQVRAIHDLGFPGIKLHPAAQKFDVLGEPAWEVYREAERVGLFLTFHTGIHWHRIKDYQVIHFDEIAYHFPKLRFSMEHVGGYHFLNEAMAVILNNMRTQDGKRLSNVYGGLTSVFDRDKQRHWYMGPERLNDVVWQVGAQQLIFGLDFPYNGIAETKVALEMLGDVELSDDERRMVLGGNLERVLGLAEGGV